MSRVPSAAKAAAKERQARTGENYTTALRHVLAAGAATGPDSPPPLKARAYATAVLGHLRELGWGAGEVYGPEDGQYEAFAGPAAGLSIAVGRSDNEDDEADPDDPAAVDVTRPLYLCSLCPASNATVDDLDFAGDTTKSPKIVARQLDAALGRRRLRRVRGVEAQSTTPCPICGDRYPAEHLLANSPSAAPVCPACVFDQDQHYCTDVPYLAVQIDQLTLDDLSAPAGWDAVAAVLALSCGRNLGTRVEKELTRRGGWPILLERWNSPLERSWIWLPPAAERHKAFRRLGAGATVQALVEALEVHDPQIRGKAKAVCRSAEVRWRDSLWPAAVAYAVAFTTQAFERDRHRMPVHVVDSTADGLSQIRTFPVTGDAINVECGLQELMEYLLFPLLLGHGLRDMPRDARRIYGAAGDDERPATQASDARIRYETDRSAQLAVLLGRIPGFEQGEVPWDGAPAAGAEGAEAYGSTRPVNDLVAAIRHEARLKAATALYDDRGVRQFEIGADAAWERLGWWIPADSAPHAVRQATAYLAENTRVQALWAGPAGSFEEPVWVLVDVVEINQHSSGPEDVPWLRVADGRSVFGLRLSDLGAVRRTGSADFDDDV